MKHFVMFLVSLLLLLTPVSAVAQRSADGRVYERWLNIHNSSSDGDEVCFVYISHIDSPGWGPDLLGPCIPSGYYQTVDPGWQQGYCVMDIMIEMASGYTFTDRINICNLTDYYVY